MCVQIFMKFLMDAEIKVLLQNGESCNSLRRQTLSNRAIQQVSKQLAKGWQLLDPLIFACYTAHNQVSEAIWQ